MKRVQIWIADDHVVVRSGLRQIISATRDLAISGESQDGSGALAAVRQEKFDVLLLDLSMPGGGVELISRLLQVKPALRVIVLTMHGEPQIAAHAVKAGAAGYVTKDASVTLLLDAIRTVASGGNFMEPGLADALLFQRVGEGEPSPEVLTRREYEIMKYLASGHSLVNIAALFNCSPKTVSVHKSRLMRKLNISNNADLFHYALRHSLVAR